MGGGIGAMTSLSSGIGIGPMIPLSTDMGIGPSIPPSRGPTSGIGDLPLSKLPLSKGPASGIGATNASAPASRLWVSGTLGIAIGGLVVVLQPTMLAAPTTAAPRTLPARTSAGTLGFGVKREVMA
jgi:hypothetical protein